MWTSDYFLSNPVDSPFFDRSGQTSLPGPGVLGGLGLGISRLGIPRQTLESKIARLGIDKRKFTIH
jgi:hypothetical protein